MKYWPQRRGGAEKRWCVDDLPQRRGGAEKIDMSVQDMLLNLAIDPRCSLPSRRVVAPSRFIPFCIPLRLCVSAALITSRSCW